MLTISNRGQAIVSTNYWDSKQARAGYCYLTWNAGALSESGSPALPGALAGALITA